jgi:hypothetical protein
LPTFVIFLQLPHRRKFAKSGQPDQGTNWKKYILIL